MARIKAAQARVPYRLWVRTRTQMLENNRELIIDYVGDHNHLGPGIRQMTEGRMEYILPAHTVAYREGDFFFETGDVSHRVQDESGEVSKHLLFEILPVEVDGASLILPRDRRSKEQRRSDRLPANVLGGNSR